MQPLTIQSFEVRVKPIWRSAIFLALLAAPCILLSIQAVRVGAAETVAQNPTAAQLRRAEWLDPANDRIERLLGSVLCTAEDPNMPEAQSHLRRAIQLGPNKALNWSALASACDLVSDNRCADEAYARAVEIAPMTPASEWAAANHYLVSNRPDQAISHFSRLLKLDPGYDWQTFRVCIRATGDPDAVYQNLVAPLNDTRLNVSFVNYLSSEREMDAAAHAWKATMAHPATFTLEAADPYLERLLEVGQGQAALKVWQDMERLGVVAQDNFARSNNLIFNGGFEQTPLNAGLDWRVFSVAYMFIDFSDTAAHSGKQCLRIDFTVPRNDEFLATYQLVPVNPDTNYALEAYVRSQNITSDSGPRLRVMDPVCPSCLNVMTDTTVDSKPWHKITLPFSTGPDTQLVNLALVRPRSRAYPMEITGSFWLDDVTLTSVGPAGQAKAVPTGQ